MYAESILIRGHRGEELAVPVTHGPAAKREGGPDGYIADCVLGGNVAVGIPVWIEILFRTDGTWDHWVTRFHGDNTYLHIEQPQRGPITEAQRRTVARWWLNLDPKPYGMSLGASVCEWAFTGFSPEQISETYGDGKKVYLTAPCDDNQNLLTGPRQTEVGHPSEALLELAVEEGRMAGAASADI